MKIIKCLIKKIGYCLIKKKIITRNEMLSNDSNDVEILRNEYIFSPKCTDSEINLYRYSERCETTKISPFFCCRISNVTLIGPYGIPVTRSGKIIQETTQETVFKYIRRTIHYLGLFEVIRQYLIAILPIRKNNLESGFHLVPRHGYMADNPNYCHWLLEDLPKIFAYSFIDKEIKIITNKTHHTWQTESLELMGFSNKNVYHHDNHGTRVRNFYVTNMRSASSRNSERDPIGRAWVAKKIINGISDIQLTTKKKRIFISRQDSGSRFITNMHEIEKVLCKHNIEIFYAGKTNFIDDVKVFLDAELIIAPHGAGMANMIFAKDCHIIEISCDTHWKKDFFYLTALELNFTFDSVQAIRDEKYENIHGIDEAWHVPSVQLDRAILNETNKIIE